MFNHEKRYSYNIDSMPPTEFDSLSNKHNYRNQGIIDTSPINRKTSLNATMVDDRHRHYNINNSLVDRSHLMSQNQEEMEYRQRANSAAGFKKNNNRASITNKMNKNGIEEQYKQTKKVYLANEDGFGREFDVINMPRETDSKQRGRTN